MHPNPDRCDELGMLFLSLWEENSELKVNMNDGSFSECGTVACHAGWFAVANNKEQGYNRGAKRYYDYEDAAKELSVFIGMKYLETWAHSNPSLWGNPWGLSMFLNKRTFKKGGNVTLKDIGIHWLKVAERIRSLDD